MLLWLLPSQPFSSQVATFTSSSTLLKLSRYCYFLLNPVQVKLLLLLPSQLCSSQVAAITSFSTLFKSVATVTPFSIPFKSCCYFYFLLNPVQVKWLLLLPSQFHLSHVATFTSFSILFKSNCCCYFPVNPVQVKLLLLLPSQPCSSQVATFTSFSTLFKSNCYCYLLHNPVQVKWLLLLPSQPYYERRVSVKGFVQSTAVKVWTETLLGWASNLPSHESKSKVLTIWPYISFKESGTESYTVAVTGCTNILY